MFWPFKRRRHQAYEYFKAKFKERMGWVSYSIVYNAWSIRHSYPDLSGPELIRLVYWGASGAKENCDGGPA